jgi:hypothetical protein
VGSLSRRVAADFSLDETAAARLSLGLGDEDMPGISLFTMPMADLYGLPKVRLTAYCADGHVFMHTCHLQLPASRGYMLLRQSRHGR